jgi:hypothetical protein
MSHNFVKQNDGSRICSSCGDERGVDEERNCPFAEEHRIGKSNIIIYFICMSVFLNHIYNFNYWLLFLRTTIIIVYQLL